MERIRELRMLFNMKQKDLADSLNVTQATIAGWETGRRKPDHDALKRLADIFDVSIDYLMGHDTPHEGEIAAAHINGGLSYKDLPPEAIQQLEDYKQFLIDKYGKKKNSP